MGTLKYLKIDIILSVLEWFCIAKVSQVAQLVNGHD